MPALVLASASPRRRDLRGAWGLHPRILPADIEEPLDFDPSAAHLATELAARKAKAARELDARPDDETHETVYLAADTIVSENGRHLGKPEDDDDALAMLLSLSGRAVEVTTGVAVLATGEERAHTRAVTTTLRMRAFDTSEARTYVATGAPRGKAGAFAIQGKGGALIDHYDGSYSNVVGLPRQATLELLRRVGIPAEG